MAVNKNKKRAAVPRSERKRHMTLYRIIRGLVKFFYPKITHEGLENLPDEPAIYVGNHTQMNGPIIGELYFPVDRDIWCISEMMHMKQVPAYAYEDFWSGKPKYIRWFYKILSYVIAPVAHVVFNSADTIEVHKNLHIIQTFKDTTENLSAGKSVIIFPESREPYNNIVYEFQPGFVDAAYYHYKKTGKDVLFVPIYNAPALKKLCFGKPVRFNHENDKEAEKKRLCGYLKEEITRVATSLPKHKVVPYPNMRKKDYPYNRQD
ncbi:MAG: 1-acyl-sn-glycerol-3-phosphate acyltransferase [Lachnospiraceae bacterium]|nr:1-acyl-sn-glycerol-3-phosphate acyltransferase [Lachnospiraceae bacterium]